MIGWFLNPALFSVLILVLSVLSMVRWLVYGDYAQAMYWLCASGLTATVTFWMGKS